MGKTQTWALLRCLLFVFLFMCICLFEKDKSWQATKFDGRPIKHLSKTCERSTDWRRQWHLKGFVHITILIFSIFQFLHINTLIFSVYLMRYPSFLYFYRGMIKNYTKSFDFLHIHYKKVWFIMQKCRKTLQNCELRNVSKFSSDQFPLNTFQQLASVQSISFSQ